MILAWLYFFKPQALTSGLFIMVFRQMHVSYAEDKGKSETRKIGEERRVTRVWKVPPPGPEDVCYLLLSHISEILQMQKEKV